MHKFCLFAILLILAACEQDNPALPEDQAIFSRRSTKLIEVCHYDQETNSRTTLHIHPNALPGHLRHGDHEGACTECDLSCLFCAYLDLLDFDEPCSTNNFAAGDYYCSRDFTNDCESNPPFVEKGESTLWDNDGFRNRSCSGDDVENDEGFLFAVYEISCTGTPFGQVQFYYDADINDDTNPVIDEIYFAATQEAYDLAVFCRSIIDQLALQYGMADSCIE